MDENKLKNLIRQKQSYLCIGLDTDIRKIPKHLAKSYDPVFEFNKKIIEATKQFAVAYKINTAFYESRGPEGWRSIERTLEVLPDDCLRIADVKRSDIGPTAEHYARAIFEVYNFHGLTVNPYMGRDSVDPYLDYFEKWTFLLTVTSNEGANDFQLVRDISNKALYEQVVKKALTWKGKGILGFVVGGTRPEAVRTVRAAAPDSFLLVPGVGIQGADLEQICEIGSNMKGGLLINVSRSIIYSGSEKDFEDKAHETAEHFARRMAPHVRTALPT
jgi:orotidine-5'-phosphate decarboxylase